MKIYRVVVTKQARKESEKLSMNDRRRIADAISSLQHEPFRGKRLLGELAGKWSLRVWPYRIIYTIEKGVVTVTVLRVGHRKDVYR